MMFRTMLIGALCAASAIAQPSDDRFMPADLARLATVAEPALSPDGRLLAYSVETTNGEADKQQSDLWRSAWDGGSPHPLTHTLDASEWLPQWSSDGRQLAFLADRGGEDGPPLARCSHRVGDLSRRKPRSHCSKLFARPDGAAHRLV